MTIFGPQPAPPLPSVAKESSVQHATVAGAMVVSSITLTANGPTITTGVGVPTNVAPCGSIYLRQDGSDKARFYMSEGTGYWFPIG